MINSAGLILCNEGKGLYSYLFFPFFLIFYEKRFKKRGFQRWMLNPLTYSKLSIEILEQGVIKYVPRQVNNKDIRTYC